jgi:hypothetical protein
VNEIALIIFLEFEKRGMFLLLFPWFFHACHRGRLISSISLYEGIEVRKMGSIVDPNLASPCGSYCGDCKYYEKSCAGCGYVKGKPFWGDCRFYSCVREKNVEHCGLCEEFPCTHFLSTYDPNEGQSRVFYRAGQLIYRRKIGTKAWLAEKAEGKNPGPK